MAQSPRRRLDFFIGGRVQKMRNEELEMRNEGGGFAANYKREEMGIA